jgi:hypothetical protein
LKRRKRSISAFCICISIIYDRLFNQKLMTA